jgi:hypothetical protein
MRRWGSVRSIEDIERIRLPRVKKPVRTPPSCASPRRRRW